MSVGTQVQADATAMRTLSGVVTDVDGALVPGATVTLLENFSVKGRSVVADANGHFSFDNVAAGPYVLTIIAKGMQPKTQRGTLNPDESVELPPIALGVAASDEVEVSGLTQEEIAEVQMKQEEKQRLAGLVPNFYVSYVWHAAPLTAKQKYKLAARTLIDPATFVIAAGFAGIEQASNEYSGFGPGWEGYGKRYGALLADGAIGGMLGERCSQCCFTRIRGTSTRGRGACGSGRGMPFRRPWWRAEITASGSPRTRACWGTLLRGRSRICIIRRRIGMVRR